MMPHRVFLMWREWLRGEWDNPSRTDYYLMQDAYCAMAPHVKNPPTFEKMKIRFKWERTRKKKEDPVEAAKRARAVSLARLGSVGALKGMTVTVAPPISETTYSDSPEMTNH